MFAHAVKNPAFALRARQEVNGVNGYVGYMHEAYDKVINSLFGISVALTRDKEWVD